METAPQASTSKVISPSPVLTKTARRKKKQAAQSGDRTASSSSSAKRAAAAQAAEEQSWVVTPISHGSSSSLPVVFTSDFSHFIQPTYTSLRIHSASTSLPVSTILDAHADLITSCLLNSANPLQVVTSSLDGTVKVWDYVEGVSLKTIKLPGAVTHLAGRQGKWYAAVKVGEKKREGSSQKRFHSIIYSISIAAPTIPLRIGKTRLCEALLLSPSSSHLVVLAETKAYCRPTSPSFIGDFVKFISPSPFTCGAFHPTEEWFATGDEKGVVRTWHCLENLSSFSSSDNGKGKGTGDGFAISSSTQPQSKRNAASSGSNRTTPTTVFHWHAHAVSSLTFSSSGTSIITGGEEAVVVLWSHATGRREFVPRVGSPISSLSVRPPAAARGEEIWVGLRAGGVKCVGADGHGGRTVLGGFEKLGIEQGWKSEAMGSIPIAYQKDLKAVLVPSSHPSSIQFFSPESGSTVAELEISPSNRPSRLDPNSPQPPAVRVTGAVLSPSTSTGLSYLATSELRPSSPLEGSVSASTLKIWRFDEISRSYTLISRLENPHGVEEIGGMAFTKSNVGGAQGWKGLVTIAKGKGEARIWRERIVKFKSGNTEVTFQPHSTLALSSPLSSASFSPDSSLLAVASTSSIHLFSPITSLPLGIFSSPDVPSPSRVHFLGPSGRYLVATGITRGITVWDLANGRVRWTSKGKRTELVEVIQDRIVLGWSKAAKMEDGRLGPVVTHFEIYDPASSTPITRRSIPEKIRSITSGPPSSFTSLVAITASLDLISLGDAPSVSRESDSTHRLISQESKSGARSLFETIFGVLPDVPSAVAQDLLEPERLGSRGLGLAKLFEGSAETLPPLRLLLDEALGGLVHTRKAEVVQQEERETEEDVIMDMEIASGVKMQKGIREVADGAVDEMTKMFEEILASPPPPPLLSAPSSTKPKTPAPKKKAPLSAASTPTTPAQATRSHDAQNIAKDKSDVPLQNEIHPVDSPMQSGGGKGRKRKMA